MATAIAPPCDESASVQYKGVLDGTTGVLVATVMGSSLAFVVGAIINVALPAMQEQFGLNAAGAQWIVNAYLLPLGALVLIGGALGDHYGRKRLFVTGLVLFTAACIVCALAPNTTILFAARAAQGVGAAMLAPNSLSIIAAAFSGAERGKAVGTWAAAGAIAGAGAPLLGGWIVDLASWRWAFAIVVPFAAATLFVAMRSVSESRSEESERAALDILGAALVTLALAALVWAMIAAPVRGLTGTVVAAFASGVLLAAAFVFVEQRKGERAMMPLGLFGTGSFVGITLLTFLLYGALGGLIVLLPYVLINSFGYSAAAAGAAILPFPLVIGTFSRMMGGIATKVGTRIVLTAGPLVVAVGFLVLSFVPADGMSYWWNVLPGLLIIASGMAISVAPLTTAVMNAVSDSHVGVASGVNNATSRIAGLIATALLGPVMVSAGAGDGSLVGGFSTAALVGSALAFASAAASWMLIAPNLDEN